MAIESLCLQELVGCTSCMVEALLDTLCSVDIAEVSVRRELTGTSFGRGIDQTPVLNTLVTDKKTREHDKGTDNDNECSNKEYKLSTGNICTGLKM